MCDNSNDDGYGEPTSNPNIYSSCSDMFWRNIYLANYIKQQYHRNLVAGNQQCCNNDLYIHTNSRSVCYNSNDDGYCEPTSNPNLYSSCSNMFW